MQFLNKKIPLFAGVFIFALLIGGVAYSQYSLLQKNNNGGNFPVDEIDKKSSSEIFFEWQKKILADWQTHGAKTYDTYYMEYYESENNAPKLSAENCYKNAAMSMVHGIDVNPAESCR